ncbi:MAG: hypothetical protein HOL86_04990 [Flavobacteriaceae bacterium]|jgi:DNA-binding CsgD family transcriptional regulator|nr:hypothetical protein [Flavobacteriaceae bacterium]
MVILKSIALGLDCDTIRLLVEISEYQYQTLCKNIFSKLQVGNSYAAVQYAFKNGLLNQKEYNSEKIKGITLEFATQNIERLESLTAGDHKRNLWEFYEFRLVHDNQINETDSPNYIRINNFGQRKTGWLTYSPIKVRMNSIGKLEYINEINQFNKTQKTYL